MCSAAPERDPPPTHDDRTTRARIRDAAIALFAEAGVAAVSLRRIAAEAGVSPGLIVHHFGSKDALRAACDEHVAATLRAHKRSAMRPGASFDPLAALRSMGDGPPLLRYLARTIGDASPRVAALVDEIVADAADYMEEGVEAGVLRPTRDPRGRAAVLTLWTLGPLVLHDHLERLLGVDLLKDELDPREAAAYFAPALEMLGGGVLTEEAYARIGAAFAGAEPGEEKEEDGR